MKQGVTCTAPNNGECAGTITEHVSSTHFSSSTIYSYVEPVACAGSKTCEDGTLRAAACTGNSTNNVEVQLATYDISKLNDLQNLDRTVNDLTVDTLHGLGPELYANPLAKAGSATGTQTIVSCDFPGQVVDVACSDPTKTTAATCVGACSDTSKTTEAECKAMTAHTITTAADGAYSVYAADVDGDGDMDVLSASVSDDKIRWYENDGQSNPTFTAHEITDQADYAISVYAADVDGDGDIDVLSASHNDDKIRWYENDGQANPTFTAHEITDQADGASSVYAVDVDGDGDMDVLSASISDNKIAWYENNGAESFTACLLYTSPSPRD